MLGKFKEEYSNELKLYKDADAAEDPTVFNQYHEYCLCLATRHLCLANLIFLRYV